MEENRLNILIIFYLIYINKTEQNNCTILERATIKLKVLITQCLFCRIAETNHLFCSTYKKNIYLFKR